MKRLLFLLPAVVFFGAGCFLYPSAPTAVVPRAVPVAPVVQPSVEQVTTTEATTTSSAEQPPTLEEEYQRDTATRKACGLPPSPYFFSDQGDVNGPVFLMERRGNGEYTALTDDISNDVGYSSGMGRACGDSGSDVVILEPKNRSVLYILSTFEKDGMHVDEFDLTKKVFMKTDLSSGTQGGLQLNFKIAPTEDRLLYVADLMETCGGPFPDNTQKCTDFERSLYLQDLQTGKVAIFAKLPKGYSYTRSVYPPNLMGEGLRSRGDVSWIDANTIRAVIYSDKTPLEYNGPERAPLKTITVKVGQANVKL